MNGAAYCSIAKDERSRGGGIVLGTEKVEAHCQKLIELRYVLEGKVIIFLCKLQWSPIQLATDCENCNCRSLT